MLDARAVHPELSAPPDDQAGKDEAARERACMGLHVVAPGKQAHRAFRTLPKCSKKARGKILEKSLAGLFEALCPFLC